MVDNQEKNGDASVSCCVCGKSIEPGDQVIRFVLDSPYRMGWLVKDGWVCHDCGDKVWSMHSGNETFSPWEVER